MASISEIADAVESVLPKRRPIGHHEPFIDKKKASIELSQCLASGISQYKHIELFEDWVKSLTGAKHALATNSGTSALHLSLLAAGIKAGDEVLVPTTTFVATANAVSYVGAIPHFIGAAPNIDADALRYYLSSKSYSEGRRIKAIIVVHLFGIPADMVNICKVADAFNIIVIEDASQALGTKIDGRHVGTFGKAGVISFNNNKILTTNGGGVVLTDDPYIHGKSENLATTWKKAHSWFMDHEGVAYNYRMGSINAALGVSQALEFGKILDSKRNLARKYRKSLENMVKFVESPLKCEQNYWLNVILTDRDGLLNELYKRGIRARAGFTPLHTFSFYASNPRHPDLTKSIEFFSDCVCLPSGAGL